MSLVDMVIESKVLGKIPSFPCRCLHTLCILIWMAVE